MRSIYLTHPFTPPSMHSSFYDITMKHSVSDLCYPAYLSPVNQARDELLDVQGAVPVKVDPPHELRQLLLGDVVPLSLQPIGQLRGLDGVAAISVQGLEQVPAVTHSCFRCSFGVQAG